MTEKESAEANPVHVLGIAGSLRAGSYNQALLRAAVELAPAGMETRTFDRLGEIPLYNADLDNDEWRPGAVRELKRQIEDADVLLVVTPEYNYGVPGVLKNALDWASRPAYRSVLVGKPVAICGASTGGVGTARAQEQLKQTLGSTLAHVLPHPPVLVSRAKKCFDAEGHLTDDKTRDTVRDLLEALRAWVQRREVRM